MNFRCPSCGLALDASLFKRTGFDKRCFWCRRKGAVSSFNRDTFKVKASGTISNHAKRHHMSHAAFSALYGWSQDVIEHDLREAMRNGLCRYCLRGYEHLREVTIDIIDPGAPPVYADNVEIICIECNRDKRQMTPSQYRAFRSSRSLWRLMQIALWLDARDSELPGIGASSEATERVDGRFQSILRSILHRRVGGGVMTRAALALALLTLAAPCEAGRWYITVAEHGMDSTCTVSDTTRVPTIGGYAVLYYQAWGETSWHYAGDARCDTLSGAFVTVDWLPTNPGIYRMYAETISDEMIVSCRRDTTAWAIIDPSPPPPPRFWRPGQH